MDVDERIQVHIVSVWRESKKLFSIHGKEGMLILTDKHLMFVHKTEVKMRWWNAVTQRQVLTFLKSKDVMIQQDGYNEEQYALRSSYRCLIASDVVAPMPVTGLRRNLAGCSSYCAIR